MRPLDREALSGEVEVSTFRGSGPGGQHRNKTETAVRLRHLPTGITVISTKHRSQWRNREAAWERLLERLGQLRRQRKPRLHTHVPVAVQHWRLEKKKRHAAKKQARRKASTED